MKKKFICLAKSQKYNGRCVAGVVIGNNENGSIYIEKNSEGKPIWIRPVSRSQHGEISDDLCNEMELLGIYEIDNVIPCPDGYQSENAFYSPAEFRRVSRIGKNEANLQACSDNTDSSILFVNRGAAIPGDKMVNLDTSIKLIKVIDGEIYVKERDERSDQYRMKFSYNGRSFDLPMTDLEFRESWDNDNSIIENSNHCYISVSVGVVYHDWYYKLVASVILL